MISGDQKTNEPIDCSDLPSPHLPSSLPRLRIHHFLAWMSVMAAMFAVLDGTRLFESSQDAWATTVIIVEHVLSSAALTCAAFGAIWWWRGLKFPSEPGHGFVILYGIGVLLSEVVLVLFSTFVDVGEVPASVRPVTDVPGWVVGFMRWSGYISGAVYVSLCIIFSIWLAGSRKWRMVFILMALNVVAATALKTSFRDIRVLASNIPLNDLVFWANMLTDAIPTGLILICVVLASLEDRRLAILRHWSHWVGVIGCSAGCSFKLIKYAVWHLFLDGV